MTDLKLKFESAEADRQKVDGINDADRQKVGGFYQTLPSAEAVHKPDYSYEADMVKRLRHAEAVQGWIPCSERLPKEYAQYLVCFESGHCYVYWLEDSDWARGMVEKEGILAWMPLPEPYKGGEE